MKRLLILIILVYATIVVTVLMLSGTLVNKDIRKAPLIAGNSNPLLADVTLYYIPVVKKTYSRLDISLTDLVKSKIVSDENNIYKLPLVFTNVTFVKSTEILSYLQNDYIGLVLTSQLQDNFKALSVNGQYYYDQMVNKDSYPLTFVFSPK
jgi:hypothetical protein